MNMAEAQNPTLRKTYLFVFSLASLVSTTVAWIYLSYFNSNFSALLVFYGQDGWCDVGTQGIGVHCFGDYAGIHFANLFQVPQGPEVVYPLVTRLFRLPFFLVETLTSYRIGLVFYLSALLLAILFPILHSYFRERQDFSLGLWILVALFNLGTISSIDRGNVIAFSVPFLYLFLIRFQDGDSKTASLYLTIATIVKPQLALFAFLFLWRTEFRVLIRFSLRTVSVIFLPYLVFGTQSVLIFRGWIDDTLKWSKSLSPTADFPTNYSFNRLFGMMGLDYSMFSLLFGVALILGLSVPFIFQRRTITVEDLIKFGLIVLCMNSIVYVYYSVLIIPMWVALFSRSRNDRGLDMKSSISRKMLPVILAAASAPLAWPSRWRIGDSIGVGGAHNAVPLFITMSIAVYILVSVTVNFCELFNRSNGNA